MADETIQIRVRDDLSSSPTQVMVEWALSAPIVGPDGNAYQFGGNLIETALTDSVAAIQLKTRKEIANIVESVTGQTFLHSDVLGVQAVRTGSVTVGALDTTAAVLFGVGMPGTAYKVIAMARGFVIPDLDYGSVTADGFTFTFTAGVAGDINYIAIEE